MKFCQLSVGFFLKLMYLVEISRSVDGTSTLQLSANPTTVNVPTTTVNVPTTTVNVPATTVNVLPTTVNVPTTSMKIDTTVLVVTTPKLTTLAEFIGSVATTLSPTNSIIETSNPSYSTSSFGFESSQTDSSNSVISSIESSVEPSTSVSDNGTTVVTSFGTGIHASSEATSPSPPTTTRSITSSATVAITSRVTSGATSTIPPAISADTKKDTDRVTLAVCLGIILPLVIIPAIIIAVICFMRRQRNKTNYGQKYDEEIGSSLKKEKGLKFTTVRKKHKPLEVISKPVLLEEFEEHVKKLGKDSGLGYAEEFESLSDVGKDQSVDVSQQQCNVSKNRYCNIRPYDITRVKLLPSEEEDGSDYINASWIPGYYSKRQFIATQGPMQSTEDDFWRMVWEYNCRGIVMVTSLIEKGRDKCHHYWPRDKEPVSYGDIEVTITKENKTDKWDIREFQVSLGQHKRFLTHCHYTIWPDMEVPDEFDSLVEFIYLAREEVSFRGAGPVIVHCSAGVGRTGTFIAIDTLLHQLEEERMVDAFGCVYRMRMNRTFMVQNEKQYVFIHNSILAVIKKMNSTDGLDNDAYEESDVNKNRGSVTSSVNPDVNGVNSRNFNTNNRIDEVHGGHDMNGKLDIVHSHSSVYGGGPTDT